MLLASCYMLHATCYMLRDMATCDALHATQHMTFPRVVRLLSTSLPVLSIMLRRIRQGTARRAHRQMTGLETASVVTMETNNPAAIATNHVSVLDHAHHVVTTTPPHAKNPLRHANDHVPLTAQQSSLFHQAQARRVPLPAPYAWDVIHTTLSDVVPNSSGMERRSVARRTTRIAWSTLPDQLSATIGTADGDATHQTSSIVTNAQVAERPTMELRDVLELRRKQPLTPYKADEWELMLRTCNLSSKYPRLHLSLQNGFDAGIRHIYDTFTPPNSPSLHTYPEIYQEIVDKEFRRGRYIGPCSQAQIEDLIGPFQSSPLSLIPKSKPGKFRAVHNFSHPASPSPVFTSINYTIDPDNYPCTWGTFSTVCFTIWNLPPGSQASIRDVAEAYRTIPILPSQWPGLVVKLRDHDSFAINTCNNFGLTSGGGIYGELGDATADVFRANGIGPISKWVDDHIFFRILREYILPYNYLRQDWHKSIMSNGGRQRAGSRLWYKGEIMPNGMYAEFDEDAGSQIQDLANFSPRSYEDSLFAYGDADIDELSDKLGIPWEKSKTISFSYEVQYLGFIWNLPSKTVSVPAEKKEKYRTAIQEWKARKTHTLNDAQKLYGKLLHATMVVPEGRAYLTSLEAMLGTFSKNPFVPHHAPRDTNDDLSWWHKTLLLPTLSRDIPGPHAVSDQNAYSDASSGFGIGIVIQSKWRAWRLVPGWKQDGRDIGWAEAVGLELLASALLHSSNPNEHFRIFGDNRGVVEGWWKGRSKNKATNAVFRRIHNISAAYGCTILTSYVPSKENPADGPSRGVYPPKSSLLPAIPIPYDLQPFIVNFDHQPLPNERIPSQNNAYEFIPKPRRPDNTDFSRPESKPSEDIDWFKASVEQATSR